MNVATKYWKRILLTLISLVLIVALAYVAMYAYLMMYAAFTWQCNIYVGEKTVEGQKVCNDFNDGGMIRVLTN